MRFGIFIPQGWRLDLVGIDPSQHWRVMNECARRADAGDWDSVWVYDHFHTTPVPTAEATHEAWTLMAALAATTTRVKLGQMCTCMGYRNPAYLAKVAATVDVISGGRAQMGIGGGWYEHEWRAYGYGFERVGQRLAQLDEGVQILRQAWSTGSATFSGRHYEIDGALVHPRPLQRPGLPLWIAGGGERKTLRIAARYADYTNFAATPEVFARKSAILAEHCAQVGTDVDRIVRSSNFNVVIGESEADVEHRLREHQSRLAPALGADRASEVVQGLRESAATGTPEQVIEALSDVGGLGMSYAICYFPDAAYTTESVELFERTVLAELGAPEQTTDPGLPAASATAAPPRPEEEIADA